MRLLLYKSLTLLAVFGLVFTPPILTGYASVRRADSAYQAGDFTQAVEEYEIALRLLPWRQDLWEQAGTVWFMAGKREQSVGYLERSQSNDSLSASGWNLLGKAYWWMGDQEKAQHTWKLGLDKFPESISLFSPALSAIYRAQGDFAMEQDLLERWLAVENEGNEAAHYRLGLLLSLLELERALQELLLAADSKPAYEPAVQSLRSALNLASLETDESRRLVIIGRGLGLVNEWELAERAFRQAVAADGENAEAWAWLGEAGQQLGRGGRTELDRALSLERENPIVRSMRGLYWTRQGKDSQALAEYLLAAEYDPKNPAWRVSVGEAYARAGDLQKALASFVRATDMQPGDPVYWRLLADFCAQYNYYVEEVGIPAVQQAIALAPDDLLALDTLGWSFLVLERYEEARYQFARALELDPQFAPAHLHLGMAAFQSGDWQAAREHWQQARDLDAGGAAGVQAQNLLNQYFP